MQIAVESFCNLLLSYFLTNNETEFNELKNQVQFEDYLSTIDNDISYDLLIALFWLHSLSSNWKDNQQQIETQINQIIMVIYENLNNYHHRGKIIAIYLKQLIKLTGVRDVEGLLDIGKKGFVSIEDGDLTSKLMALISPNYIKCKEFRNQGRNIHYLMMHIFIYNPKNFIGNWQWSLEFLRGLTFKYYVVFKYLLEPKICEVDQNVVFLLKEADILRELVHIKILFYLISYFNSNQTKHWELEREQRKIISYISLTLPALMESEMEADKSIVNHLEIFIKFVTGNTVLTVESLTNALETCVKLKLKSGNKSHGLSTYPNNCLSDFPADTIKLFDLFTWETEDDLFANDIFRQYFIEDNIIVD